MEAYASTSSQRKSKGHKKRHSDSSALAPQAYSPSMDAIPDMIRKADPIPFAGSQIDALAGNAEEALYDGHKHRKKKRKTHDANHIESAADLPDIGGGSRLDSHGSTKLKNQKRHEASDDAQIGLDSMFAGSSIIDPSLAAPDSTRKKRKKHMAAPVYVPAEQPGQDSSGEFIIEEDEDYVGGHGEKEAHAFEEGHVSEDRESPKRKKKKGKASVQLTAQDYESMAQLLHANNGSAPFAALSRPSLSLMGDIHANAFFQSSAGAPHFAVPSFENIPLDPALTDSHATDTTLLLRKVNQQATQARRIDVQKRKDYGRQREGPEHQAGGENAAQRIEPKELVAARAQNQLDNDALEQSKSDTKGRRANLSEAEEEKLLHLEDAIYGLSPEEVLATKWLGQTSLDMLSASLGFTFKTGRFTDSEDIIIRDAVERYKNSAGMNDADWNVFINENNRNHSSGDRSVFCDIARELGKRPVTGVYNRVKRLYTSTGKKGKWTEEEDKLLQQSYDSHGPNWIKAADLVGRAAADCRDRWRNILVDKDVRDDMGRAWSAEEEQLLDQTVRRVAKEKKIDILRDPQPPGMPWLAVSKVFEGRRSRLSCANRWTSITYRMLISRGELLAWTPFDTYMLYKRLHALNCASAKAVNWSSLNTSDWTLYSGDMLMRHHKQDLKSNPQAAAAQTHREAVQIFYDQYCANVDPDTLERPKYTSYKGLKELPTVPLESYGQRSKKYIRPGARKPTGRKRTTKKQSQGTKASASDPHEPDVDVEAATAGAPFGRSSEWIEDSDAEAGDM